MKVLYILPSYNIYGGTPKKTLDLLRYFGDRSFLYVYSAEYIEFKGAFRETGACVIEANFGRNLVRHLRSLLKVIDDQNIEIVQAQFSMGEVLVSLLKCFRPRIKVIVAFVGVNKPSIGKRFILSFLYRSVDSFVYISHYVRERKLEQFPMLANRRSETIYNGTEKREDTGGSLPVFKGLSYLTVGGLTKIKNIDVLIDAMSILVNHFQRKNVALYVLGDGPEREILANKIASMSLENNVIIVGYSNNVGGFLDHCDGYLHPCYEEGFGIAVAEAMIAEKSVVVADAGALPELVEDGVSGTVVDPRDAKAWADAIIHLIDDPERASRLAEAAKNRAGNLFSVEKFVRSYDNLYRSLLREN